MFPGELRFALAAGRMRAQLGWASALALGATATSWAIQHTTGWAPSFGGGVWLVAMAAVVVASRSRLSAVALAWVSLATVGAALLAVGSSLLAGNREGIIGAFPALPLGVASTALVAAGVHTARTAGSARGRVLFGAAAALALLYYFWPSPAEGPLARGLVLLRPLARHAPLTNLASACILLTLALCPSLLVGLGLLHARRRPEHPASLGALLALYGPPALSWPVVMRALAGRPGDFGALAIIGCELVASLSLLWLLAHAAAFAVEYGAPALSPDPRRWSRRTRALALAVLAVLTLAPWAFARQPVGPWRPGPPSSRARALFAERLTAWNDARGAEARTRGAELRASARELDPALGQAVSRLVDGANQRDLAVEAWERRVAEVNEASRRAGLPYYVDPTETVVTSSGSQRWFRLDSYRVESAQRYRVGPRRFDVLRLQALTPERPHAALLGLSRDSAPYALVLIDSIADYAAELRALGSANPPRCAKLSDASAPRRAAVARCGEVLAAILAGAPLEDRLARAVARHELQHQIDGGTPPVAKILAAASAVPPRINRELSAYLAELASPESAAKLSLVRLFRIALIDANHVDGAAAGLALLLLARHAAPDTTPEACFAALASLGPGELRARAAAAWQSEFGAELVEPVPSPD